jgi:hypothetical protein
MDDNWLPQWSHELKHHVLDPLQSLSADIHTFVENQHQNLVANARVSHGWATCEAFLAKELSYVKKCFQYGTEHVEKGISRTDNCIQVQSSSLDAYTEVRSLVALVYISFLALLRQLSKRQRL